MSGSDQSVSGGLDMGRERLQSKNMYSYLGEDSQTRPLEDLGNRLMETYNQGNAQSNLLFGGPGYGGSFLPANARGGGAPPGAGGPTSPPGTTPPVNQYPTPATPGGRPYPGTTPGQPGAPAGGAPTGGGPVAGGGGTPAKPRTGPDNQAPPPVNATTPNAGNGAAPVGLFDVDPSTLNAAQLRVYNDPVYQRQGAWNKSFNQAFPGMGQRGPGDLSALTGTSATNDQVAAGLKAAMARSGNNPTAAFTQSHDDPITYMAQQFKAGNYDPSKWDWKTTASGGTVQSPQGGGQPTTPTTPTIPGGPPVAQAEAELPGASSVKTGGGGDYEALTSALSSMGLDLSQFDPQMLASLGLSGGDEATVPDPANVRANGGPVATVPTPTGDPSPAGGGPVGANGPGTQPPTAPPPGGYAQGLNPRYGKWNPASQSYEMFQRDPKKDPGGIHDPNYNPADPTWKYYAEQGGNTYYPLDPSKRNDEDLARTSPVTPQGSNYNDAWSTSPEWRPEAPEGGLYGGYNALTGQGPQTAGEAMQEGFSKGMASGAIGGMGDQNVQDLLGGYEDFAANPMSADDQTAKNFMFQLAGNASDPEANQLAGYKAMLANPGYSDAAKSAIGHEGMLGARAASATNAAQIQNMARRTNNPMAAYGALGQIGQGEADAYGTMARNNAIGFENEAIRQRETALQGLGQNAGISNQRQLGAGNLGANFLNTLRGQKLQAMGQQGQELGNAYNRQAQGVAALGASNQQLLNRRMQGYSGLNDLYKGQQGQNNSLLQQLQSLYGTRRQDATELGKTTGQGGLSG